MCCPEGKVLKLKRYNRPAGIPFYADYVPKCVRSGRADKDTLDGAEITVTDSDDSEKDMVMVVKKIGVMLPNCPLGLTVQRVSLNNSGI